MHRASSHSEKRASEWVEVYEAKNVARGSAKERMVCTLQGAAQKGKCKEKRFEVLPEAKKRLADKAYSIPKGCYEETDSRKEYLNSARFSVCQPVCRRICKK